MAGERRLATGLEVVCYRYLLGSIYCRECARMTSAVYITGKMKNTCTSIQNQGVIFSKYCVDAANGLCRSNMLFSWYTFPGARLVEVLGCTLAGASENRPTVTTFLQPRPRQTAKDL